MSRLTKVTDETNFTKKHTQGFPDPLKNAKPLLYNSPASLVLSTRIVKNFGLPSSSSVFFLPPFAPRESSRPPPKPLPHPLQQVAAPPMKPPPLHTLHLAMVSPLQPMTTSHVRLVAASSLQPAVEYSCLFLLKP